MRLALVFALAACATAPHPLARALPRTDTLLDPGAGTFVPSERYRGHVVVLDFWAGWCEECRKQVPQLVRLAAAFGGDGLVLVGVNAGEPPADASRYARELGITYPIALDPELAFSDRVDAGDLPVLLVIDRTGTIVHRSRRLDEETLGVIRTLLHAPR